VRSRVERRLNGDLQRVLDKARLAHIGPDRVGTSQFTQLAHASFDLRQPFG
jgi:hypothetical protein